MGSLPYICSFYRSIIILFTRMANRAVLQDENPENR